MATVSWIRGKPGLLCAIVFACLCLFAGGAALALDPSRPLSAYGRDLWRTADGLPQGSVQTIVQSRDGYLWFGTQEGLVRFDGVRFTVFNPGNTPAIVGRNIEVIVEARNGDLWVGIGGGGLVRYRAGTFENVPMPGLRAGGQRLGQRQRHLPGVAHRFEPAH